MPKTPKSKPPPPPPISQRRSRARSRSRSKSKSPESVRLGPGTFFTKRPSELYCVTSNLDIEKGEQYNREIHFSGKYKTNENGFVYDENGNLIENTLEEGIKARCGKFYNTKQLTRIINKAKGKTASHKESLKLESLGGRRRRRSNRK